MKYEFSLFFALAWRHIYYRACTCFDKIRTWMLLHAWGVKFGRNVVFIGRAILNAHRRGDITIGDNVTFLARGIINHVGLLGPTILSCLDDGNIAIGSNCGFSSVVMSSRIGIRIGSHVNIGGNTRIFDHDFHALDPVLRRQGKIGRCKPVEIDDDVFIGTNAIILKGTHIGARSIVAAGSVVFGLDIPPDSMVKGNPAVITGARKV